MWESIKRPAAAEPVKAQNGWSPIHHAGRREWNEQVGTLASSVWHGRIVTLAALAIGGLCVYGYVGERGKNHVVPFVVQVNKLGDAVAFQRADATGPTDPLLIRSMLAEWVCNIRTVLTDVRGQRALIAKAFDYVAPQSPAEIKLKQWFSENVPWNRAATDTVACEVQSVQPIGGSVWRVEWKENTSTRGGVLETSVNWMAQITIAINPPTAEDEVLKDPLGIRTVDFHWGKRPVS